MYDTIGRVDVLTRHVRVVNHDRANVVLHGDRIALDSLDLYETVGGTEL